MKIGDLTPRELRVRLAGPGLRLRTGPAVLSIRSRVPAVAEGMALHYARHDSPDTATLADFHVSVERPRSLRRWLQPQVVFGFDGTSPFTPLPGDQGFPMLEWGMNWCISTHLHRYLILHAAVLERNGRALILPAPPGSGKSTLCAGLAWRGWRLLSDELALIDPASGRVSPLPRPVSLKNRSIEVIRAFAPEARFGRVVRETIKGEVAHFQPPAEAVERGGETALPAWVVLPRYEAGVPTRLTRMSRGQALMALVDNAFNYHVHGAAGFQALADLVEHGESFRFHYSQLAEAAPLFERLAAGERGMVVDDAGG
ncbi:Aldolase [Rubrivivax sp. A210]|uniref:HprK-related kinase A n=1 Tax=Rubrivivax sp. A210 TaxID=2772301 RepID=UPI001919F224|nr:HprK-related kinase A [Rubrivivax sp. A210]CAD5375194.1 Aldolase [Rubrivivax sp. A210]